MQKNQIHKRKAAGFIRTNSNKALHTFKQTSHLKQSSSDFSSFQNNNPNQLSDSQFSPYKNQPDSKSHHSTRPNNLPPLPPASSLHSLRSPTSHVPSKIFSNQKLNKNYQVDNYTNSNINDSPNAGRIINKREEQIRQNLRKRAQVEKQLKDINRICTEIQNMKNPNYDRSKQKSIGRDYRLGMPRQGQKSRQKPKFSKQKECRQTNQAQQFQEASFKSSPSNQKKTHGSQNNIFSNQSSNERQYQGIKKNIQNRNQRLDPIQYSYSQQYSSFQYQQSQALNYQTNKNGSKKLHPPQQTQLNQQSAQFNYQQTFKPDGNQQILTSLQRYKRLHEQNYQPEHTKTNDVQNSQFVSFNQQQIIKDQHQKAKYKFIQKNLNQNQDQSSSNSQQEQYQQEQLIQQYPKQQFKRTTLKQAIATRYQAKQKTQDNQGIYKAKGGICFDLDINQFTQPDNQKGKGRHERATYANNVVKKGKKPNTKQQILKRRQMAKNYDKISRAKVFGGF